MLFLQVLEGVQRFQNSLHFNFFKNEVRGGGHQISFFSQIQNSPHYPRGGGSRKLWTFPKFCDIFNFDGSPKDVHMNYI